MASSKEVSKDAPDEKTQRTVAAILRHCAMNVLERDLTIQTEVELFKQMGNTAEAAAYMATAQSFSGLGEFVLNPLFAQLSDRFGRKPFVNMLCMYALFGNSILALNPFAKIGKVPFVVLNRALIGLLSSQSGSVMGTNALSDVSSGAQLGGNLASMSGHFGFGMVVGPWIGNQALKAGGQKAVYRIRMAISLTHLIHNLAMVPETLLKTKPFDVQGLNPLGCLKLLWIGDIPLLSKLCRSLLVCTCEQKNLINTKALWLKENLKLGFEESQNVMMAYSMSIWASGQFLAKKFMKMIGAGMFSDATAVLNTIAFAVWANAKGRLALWLGLLLHVPGVNGTGASMVKADMMTRAAELGIGKGEMNSYYMNLRAAGVMFVPQLMARLYIARLPHGKSGDAWYLLAFFAALSAFLRA